MINFYSLVKNNLNFNRFQFDETVCLEYRCPIDADKVSLFSRNDFIVHVLSGKKTYKSLQHEFTLSPGDTIYFKKGAEFAIQHFDDEYCMLGFFFSDDLIKETFTEVKGKVTIDKSENQIEKSAFVVDKTNFLESYFQSMLFYFRGIDRPPDHILLLKLKELLFTLMNADPGLAAYYSTLASSSKPNLQQIMEHNFSFNLKLEEYAELSHRSLSTFKREFQQCFGMSPGKWLLKRRIEYASQLLINTDDSISQIAYDSGFEDVSHFSRSFKDLVGQTPTDFKQSIANSSP